MGNIIFQSFLETLCMTAGASLIGVLVGGPLAIILYITRKEGVWETPWIHHSLGALINSVRSVPYIILTILLIPFTRLITGSSIGTVSAIVPLGVSAILLTARVFEDIFKTIPKSYTELGLSLGASRLQIIQKIILPEAMPTLVSGLTLIIINLIGFSAMAGAVGGGGLGDLAIRYGYHRYDLSLLAVVVLILIVWVHLIQVLGDKLSSCLRR